MKDHHNHTPKSPPSKDSTSSLPMTHSPLTLILMRHGESPLRAPSDFERSLSERGCTQSDETASSMIDHLTAHPRLALERACVSEATRTQQTWAIVKNRLTLAEHWRPQLASIAFERSLDLYLASAHRWLETLYAQAPSMEGVDLNASPVRGVICVGHNPGLSELLEALTGQRHHLSVGEAFILSKEVDSRSPWLSAGVGHWSIEARCTPNSPI